MVHGASSDLVAGRPPWPIRIACWTSPAGKETSRRAIAGPIVREERQFNLRQKKQPPQPISPLPLRPHMAHSSIHDRASGTAKGASRSHSSREDRRMHRPLICRTSRTHPNSTPQIQSSRNELQHIPQKYGTVASKRYSTCPLDRRPAEKYSFVDFILT